jgi:hypothetical protein
MPDTNNQVPGPEQERAAPAPASWRDVLSIHPAAELFPLMADTDPAALKALGEDIIKHGLASPIALWSDGKSPARLLDGRNRLDAIELVTGSPAEVGAPSIIAGKNFLACNTVITLGPPVDPLTYVISANLHRRHLTAEERRELIATVIKVDPSRSDRQIAETVKVDHKTVGAVRAEQEARGEIPHVSTRTDSAGRKQPAKRTRNHIRTRLNREMKLGADTVAALEGTTLASAREQDELIVLNRGAREGEHTEPVKQLIAAAVSGKDVSAVAYTKSGAAFRREDISSQVPEEILQQRAAAGERIRGLLGDDEIRNDTESDGVGEIAPTDVREELQAQLRHVGAENIALRSQVRELTAGLATKLAGVSNERLHAELERRLSPQFLRAHQVALQAIRRALDAPGRHNGPTLELEVISSTDSSEATKH